MSKESKAMTDVTKKGYSVSGYEDLVLMLYHITDIESANAIEASQKMIPGKAGMLGAGIYFADSEEAAARKAIHKGVVLKCLVRVGRIMVLTREHNHGITPDMLAKLGLDSIKGVEYNTGSEYVVYKSEQVLAAWVVKGALGERILFPADSTDPRPVCPYGKRCCCRNPAHFQQFKHSLAPSFPMRTPLPKKEPCKDGDKCRVVSIEHFERFSHPASVVVPGALCPYGTRCYRKDPDHFKKYKHPQAQCTHTKASSPPKGSSHEQTEHPILCSSMRTTAFFFVVVAIATAFFASWNALFFT